MAISGPNSVLINDGMYLYPRRPLKKQANWLLNANSCAPFDMCNISVKKDSETYVMSSNYYFPLHQIRSASLAKIYWISFTGYMDCSDSIL